jgi:hypothetical protein
MYGVRVVKANISHMKTVKTIKICFHGNGVGLGGGSGGVSTGGSSIGCGSMICVSKDCSSGELEDPSACVLCDMLDFQFLRLNKLSAEIQI